MEFSAYNQYLTLQNYPLLTNAGVGIDLCKGVITDFFVVDCPKMQPIEVLFDIMTAQESQGAAHALKRVRAVGFDEIYRDYVVIDKLAELANGGYEGLSSDGLAGEDAVPVLDGKILLYSNVYEDSVEMLRNTFKKLKLNIIGEFYVRFTDKVVLDLIARTYGDGIGTKMEQIRNITNLNHLFEGNTSIIYFNEFELFSGYNSPAWAVFKGCTSLKSARVPPHIKIIYGEVFYNCTSLEEIDLSKIESINKDCFRNAGLISVNLENISILDRSFPYCKKMQYAKLGNNIKEIKSVFIDNTSLTEIDLGTSVNSIAYEFQNSPLTTITIRAIAPPVLTQSFQRIDASCKFYVPDASVSTYKTATNWSQYASRIYPISQKP